MIENLLSGFLEIFSEKGGEARKGLLFNDV